MMRLYDFWLHRFMVRLVLTVAVLLVVYLGGFR